MQNPQIKFTYSDYLLLPEQDSRELIGGDFYMVPSPGSRHQRISRDLGGLLWDFVRRNGLGEVLWAPMDVVLDDGNVVQPDILFVSSERRAIITDSYIAGAPDLVVEILSPSTADRDRRLKMSIYARFGVAEYWIVDPDEASIQVMRLEADGYATAGTHTSGAVSSPIIPGLQIDVNQVFA